MQNLSSGDSCVSSYLLSGTHSASPGNRGEMWLASSGLFS